MNRKYITFFLTLAFGSLLALTAFNCSTGVEPSPRPGIVRITLQADPADTSIVIVSDTFSVSHGDYFGVKFFQGKVFSDTNYAFLFETKESYNIEEVTVNVLSRHDNEYRRFIVYECYVPPGEYDKIQFGLESSVLKLGNFEIPVEVPFGVNKLMDFQQNFTIHENRVTEINFGISPFKSVQRYRDKFHFTREIKIKDVKYY